MIKYNFIQSVAISENIQFDGSPIIKGRVHPILDENMTN